MPIVLSRTRIRSISPALFPSSECDARDTAVPANACVQLELLTKVQLRSHFATVRPADIGKAHRSEENCIGVAARLHRVRRQRIAAASISFAPAAYSFQFR